MSAAQYRPGPQVAWVVGSDVLPDDDGVYLVQVPDGRPLVLTGIGGLIWILALEGRPVARDLADLTGENLELVTATVEAFLDDLVARQLLVPIQE